MGSPTATPCRAPSPASPTTRPRTSARSSPPARSWRTCSARVSLRCADLGEPLAQPVADLLRRVGAAAALRPRDDHPRRGDADESGDAEHLPPTHRSRLTVVTRITLDEATSLTRTGDIWVFRGRTRADRAIQVTTNSPVNHVGMAVVLEDLPPLMWHAELGRSLPDLWSGGHHRGVQLHDLRDAVLVWARRYGQRAWLRQLEPPVPQDMED